MDPLPSHASISPKTVGVNPGSLKQTKKMAPKKTIQTDLELLNPEKRQVPLRKLARIVHDKKSKIKSKAAAPLEIFTAQYNTVLESQQKKGKFKPSYTDRLSRPEQKTITIGSTGRKKQLSNIGVNR